MTLASITRGVLDVPIRTLVIGVEGVGKTTFGAQAPAPVFLASEDGTHHVDVPRFPQPETWTEALDAVAALTNGEHAHRTLVVDTVDWLEPMVWAHVCARDSQRDIEAYGYGKGYVTALDEWRILLARLDRLRAAKRTGIVLLAHSQIRTFKNPEGEDFDRYEMKLHQRAAGLLKEWADVVMFANFETGVRKDERTKRYKGVMTDARVLYTQRSAAYDAKSRFPLPQQIPLDWAEYEAALRAGRTGATAELETAIETLAAQIGGDVQQQALALLEPRRGNADALAQLHNRLAARAAAQAS